jgi:4-nitrophenyl phosphatase
MSHRLLIFDLDGTLYRGEEVISGAPEVVAELRSRGSEVRFLTNNSGRTREALAEKLAKMGFGAVPTEVVSSATATAGYCAERGLRRAFVVGEPGLVATLRAQGVEVVNASDDGLTTATRNREGRVDAVIVGICRHFDYPMMDAAMQFLLAGAQFVATNRDATFPLEGGRFQPGAGSVVAGIATCAGQEPFVVGKPNPYMIEAILRESGVGPGEALLIGDRLDTDIESGRRAGCDTYLVLTGVETCLPQGQAGGADLRPLLD